MFKKLFATSALAVFLIAPGHADDMSVTVAVPAAPTTAEEVAAKDAAIYAAAEKICDKVQYVGIERFYAARAKKECVSKAVASATVTTPEGEVLAYADFVKANLD